MATHQFQTEVNQLLNLIVHSLYSHKEIFLRGTHFNSSDALDKLKYLTLTDEAFKSMEFDPRVDIGFPTPNGSKNAHRYRQWNRDEPGGSGRESRYDRQERDEGVLGTTHRGREKRQ